MNETYPTTDLHKDVTIPSLFIPEKKTENLEQKRYYPSTKEEIEAALLFAKEELNIKADILSKYRVEDKEHTFNYGSIASYHRVTKTVIFHIPPSYETIFHECVHFWQDENDLIKNIPAFYYEEYYRSDIEIEARYAGFILMQKYFKKLGLKLLNPRLSLE